MIFPLRAVALLIFTSVFNHKNKAYEKIYLTHVVFLNDDDDFQCTNTE